LGAPLSSTAKLKPRSDLDIRPTVAVIVPAHNARATLPVCLAAIHAMAWQPDELILFSDGSTDETEEIAREAGATVLRNEGRPRGPAYGRNEGARAAKSDLVLFVDADVVISQDALELLIADMQESGAKAAFGSYDDTPQSQRATSLYANLRHHFVHQNGSRDASTFWSGLGLVDRQAFLDAGGFDADLFAHPSIEDIELGARLVAAGHRIRLVPEALCKHWKDWSLWRVWHTDVVRRALPWSRLLADGKTGGNDLNVSGAERVRAAVALLIAALLGGSLLCTGIELFTPAKTPAFKLWTATGLAVFIYVWLNREFFAFLARRLPPVRTAIAMTMHWCYHIYAPVTYVLVLVRTRLGLRGASA